MADFLSSGKFLPSEWTLNPLFVCFQRFCQVIVPRPEIDLLRPPSICSFPSFLPVAGFFKLGRWSHSPSGGQAFHCLPSHPSRSSPQSWRRSLRKDRTFWLWGLRDIDSWSCYLFWRDIPELSLFWRTFVYQPLSRQPLFCGVTTSLWPLFLTL